MTDTLVEVTQADKNRAHALIKAMGLTAELTSWKHPYNAFSAQRTASTAALQERIEKLEAENEQLRGALRPFAKMAGKYDPSEDDDFEMPWDFKAMDLNLGMLRKAREALKGQS